MEEGGGGGGGGSDVGLNLRVLDMLEYSYVLSKKAASLEES